MNTRILSDDFIDEAQVRFARATTKELARYIEAATIDAMIQRRLKKIDAFKCPQCKGDTLRAFLHEGEQAFECLRCGHWGTLGWGFQQP